MANHARINASSANGLTARPSSPPLRSTSHKQGRIAGENAAGGNRSFAGSLGTQSVRLLDRMIAATGSCDADARAHGYDTLAIEAKTYDDELYGLATLRVAYYCAHEFATSYPWDAPPLPIGQYRQGPFGMTITPSVRMSSMVELISLMVSRRRPK